MTAPFKNHTDGRQCRDEMNTVAALAEVFAAGVLRLHKRRSLCGRHADNSKKSCTKTANEGLEVSAETVLSVQSG